MSTSARKRIAVAALAAGAVLGGGLAVGAGERAAAGIAARPNVVLITTDDQTADSLRVMKRTRELVGDRGASFERYFASFPLCCPARATWITGQYPHNHGVIDNQPASGGGYENLREPERVLPAWLDAAGYDTMLAGKWIHNYPGVEPPPGWDRWHGLVPATVTSYYNYSLADSAGGLTGYGEADSDYQSDVLTREYALPFIAEHAADPDPFFLHLSYTAPHWGRGRPDAAGTRCASPQPFDFETARAKPAPRHAEAFRERKFPRPPSFGERDISDKPAIVRKGRRIFRRERREIAGRYRCELASLLAVDEGVAQVDAALEAAGASGDTYVIFTSDNGLMHGEHRIRGGKVQPYEEAIRLPMLIRGPGIAPRTEVAEPAGDVDLVPTILGLTGVSPPPASARLQDGRSLLAGVEGDPRPRRAILIEAKRPPRATATGAVGRSFIGVRTRRYAYFERYDARFASVEEGRPAPIGAGERVDRELYDLKRDPYQLSSRHRGGVYAAPRRALADALAALRACAGDPCLLEPRIPPPSRPSR